MNLRVLKKELRQEIKQKKKLLSKEQRLRCAKEVFKKLEKTPEFINAEHILCYWALPDELSTQQFIDRWYKQKKIYLPRVVHSELEIIPFSGLDRMTAGAYGILEPLGHNITDLSVLDLVIVPGIAFSEKNARLGRGGGFYDRFLPKVPDAIKIGVGYQFQIKDHIPAEEHDVKMDRIITG